MVLGYSKQCFVIYNRIYRSKLCYSACSRDTDLKKSRYCNILKAKWKVSKKALVVLAARVIV